MKKITFMLLAIIAFVIIREKEVIMEYLNNIQTEVVVNLQDSEVGEVWISDDLQIAAKKPLFRQAYLYKLEPTDFKLEPFCAYFKDGFYTEFGVSILYSFERDPESLEKLASDVRYDGEFLVERACVLFIRQEFLKALDTIKSTDFNSKELQREIIEKISAHAKIGFAEHGIELHSVQIQLPNEFM